MPPEIAPDKQESTSEDLDLGIDPIAPVRMKPAAFARWLGVSKQAVSVWIKKEWVSTFADGTLDPVRAIEELDRNKGLKNIRAGIFRRFSKEAYALRLRVEEVQTMFKVCSLEKRNVEQSLAQVNQGLREVFNELLVVGAWQELFCEAIEALGLQQRAANPEDWSLLIESTFEKCGDAARSKVAESRSDIINAMDMVHIYHLIQAAPTSCVSGDTRPSDEC